MVCWILKWESLLMKFLFCSVHFYTATMITYITSLLHTSCKKNPAQIAIIFKELWLIIGKPVDIRWIYRALNYIWKLQVTINETSKKWGALKTLSNLSTPSVPVVTSQNVVMVKACLAGVRVEISTFGGIPLSLCFLSS